MKNRRTLFGTIAFLVGRRIAERIIRRELRRRLDALTGRRRRWRGLRLVGGALAAVGAAAAAVAFLRRG